MALEHGMAEQSRRWNLWVDECPRPGWANMAIDAALLDLAERGEGWFRLYTWSPHCLSFGRHEPATSRYDVELIQARGLDTVRRPTGGRAVWHARELTYAVAAPHQWFGSLAEAYRAIHLLLAGALEVHGIPVALARQAEALPLDSGPCFARPVGGEVLVDGKKVVGSAQLRRGGVLLQHGSIILQDDQRLLQDLVRNGGRQPIPAFAPPATLMDSTGRALDPERLSATVGNRARHAWPGQWEEVIDPLPALQVAASHFEQFRSSTWTWNR